MKIEGSFDQNLSPRISISVGAEQISVVVDTGFNGQLTLPLTVLEEAGFNFLMKSEAELADGSIVESTYYTGKINWFGKTVTVNAIATGSEDGLLGTQMLHGLKLFMDLDESKVTLENKAF